VCSGLPIVHADEIDGIIAEQTREKQRSGLSLVADARHGYCLGEEGFSSE
jgi:hypothetical protein